MIERGRVSYKCVSILTVWRVNSTLRVVCEIAAVAEALSRNDEALGFGVEGGVWIFLII